MLDWLLNCDPAIRWQTMRDLTACDKPSLAAERARVSREGVGAAILAAQRADGCWRREGKPAWVSTLFTLLLLRSTGVDPSEPAVQSAIARLEANCRWSHHDGRWDLRAPEFGGNSFFEGEVEPCINGGVLALGGYFGRAAERLAQAGRGTARGRRLELRCAKEQPLVLSHHDLCAGGSAGI